MKLSWLLFIGGLLTLPVRAEPVQADNTHCHHWPQGMVFVGLTEVGWESYGVTKTGQPPEKIALNTEARTPVMSSVSQSVFYLDAAGQVGRYSLKSRKTQILLSPSAEAGYAQPEIDDKNNALYIVQLKQGKSVDTDILRLDLATHTTKPLVIQRSAQFEPKLAHPWLYYSSVHCVIGCGKIIQEIWRYHIVGGLAEQITLLNTISRQPTVDPRNKWLYFSSNAAGNYHIYRQSLTDDNRRSPQQLTEGAVTDMSPSLYQDRLYFIRQHSTGADLMCRNAQSEFYQMPLPQGIQAIRDLEI